MQNLPPKVQDHLSAKSGRRHYRGVMGRVWRRGGLRGFLAIPFLYLAARGETLFPETGRDIPFSLENICTTDVSGKCRMSWRREFSFPTRTRCFTAEMWFDTTRGTIIDWLGKNRLLEVELHPRVQNGIFRMTSGRQWLCSRFGKIRLPRLFTGQATVVENQTEDGHLQIAVTIRNPILGTFFGYHGLFSQEKNHSE